MPPLSADEEFALAQRVEARDMAAKYLLVEANLYLVPPIAKRNVGRGLPLLELTEAGNLGLIRAVERFDYRKGARFAPYASRWIRRAIARAIADHARAVRGPGQVTHRTNALQRSQRALALELSPALSSAEIASGTDAAIEAFGEIMQAGELDRVLSVLKQRERIVLELRYGLNGRQARTLDEICRSFGLTRKRIHQIEAKARVALRSCRDPLRLRDFLR